MSLVELPRVRCGICRRVLDYGLESGDALRSRRHLPVSDAERHVMQQMVDAYGPGLQQFEDVEASPGPKTAIRLTAHMEAQLVGAVGDRRSTTMTWRCPGRGSAKGRAGHVHQIRCDRWQAFLEHRRASGRGSEDVFLGVDV